MAAPAGEKLRTVLDYVPCEACLTQVVDDQELLCSICRRLDRQVGVRVAVRTTFILERPDAAPAAPVLIAPPPPAAVDVVFRAPGEAAPAGAPEAIRVVLEPLEEEPAPLVAPPPAAPVEEPEPEGHLWDDVAEFTGFPSDLVSMTPAAERVARAPAPPPPAPEPARAEEPVEFPQDDYVFRPPAEEEPPAPPLVESVVEEEWLPQEEVPVRGRDESTGWERPAEAPVEAAPAVEEEILETTPVAEEPEEEIQETTMVAAEEDVVETTLVDDAPRADSDLWRLRGFDADAARRLRAAGIESVSHLSGHDANELAARTGIDPVRLLDWVDVADLHEDVGVPLEAGNALVAGGIRGPNGLRDATPGDVVERVRAAGGAVEARDVQRWKRRV